MANPLFNRFHNQGQVQANSPFSNLSNMMSQFNQFRNQFQGDPKATVQSLLDSGKMSQEQFNQLSNVAQQLQGVMGMRR